MDSTRRQLVASLGLLLSSPALVANERPSAVPGLPDGYRLVAAAAGIPAVILFGVALQESALMFGDRGRRRPLPWPWTLNIAGSPARFATRVDAEHRLSESLRSGIDSVDVGPMGINWRFHKARLVSVEQALDPYWNLRVGAELLLLHFDASRSWALAVGQYHAPADEQRAAGYSASVFARLRRLGHV